MKRDVTLASSAGAQVPGVERPIPALEGDFSLNAANVIGADLMLRSGLGLVTPTHDLNAAQIGRMAQQLGSRAGRLEVILHQHLPIFHTEHCVFCRCAWAWARLVDTTTTTTTTTSPGY
jgi:hypothetical protein